MYPHRYKDLRGKMVSSSTYNSWTCMRNRCNNPKNPKYKNYGGRGIKHCFRWNFFHAFLEDMGERPKGLTLNRVDNNGDYTKDNCDWATDYQQSINRRMKSTNTSGVTGVSYNKNMDKYQARIDNKHLGFFSTIDEAVAVRKAAENVRTV